jgi:O-antigen ligase/polysaccharide polymerase Wzy-like membrane protein
VEHADTAQLAAVGGALGSVLALLARGRVTLLAGLVVLALAEGGLMLALGTAGADSLTSPAGAAAAVAGLAVLAAGAAILVKRPGLVPLAVLVAAPFRPPIDFSAGNRFLVSIARDGALGRLLPLYVVLIAAALALAVGALRGARVRAVPRVIALPAAAFFAVAMCSLLWADDVEAGANVIVFFTLPFAVLLAVVGRAPFPDWLPKALAIAALSLAGLFAVVGLWQAATHELFFFAPNLEVSNANTDYFRVTSLFGDPSLYGRHVVLGIGVLLALLAARRIAVWPGIALLAVLWAGLLFSYSQSSMAALVVVTLAIAFAAGDRQLRRAVGVVALAAAVAAGGYVAARVITGGSLNQITSDRTQRVEDTARVIADNPLIGVGIGGQPRASRDAKHSDRPTASFVSHTTPLTVAAELGVVGLALYTWLLAGGVRAIAAVRSRADALGLALGAAFLGLFVHALFYSGFLEDPLTWVVLALAGAYLANTEAHATAAERARERQSRRSPAAAAS